jgi:hypothetical protein
MTFLSAGIATFISMHVFSFLLLIIISGLFAVTSLAVLLLLLLLLLFVSFLSVNCPLLFVSVCCAVSVIGHLAVHWAH